MKCLNKQSTQCFYIIGQVRVNVSWAIKFYTKLHEHETKSTFGYNKKKKHTIIWYNLILEIF